MMLFTNDREQAREMFFNVWQKHLNRENLEPLERQLLGVILDHPEYHLMLSDPDYYLHKEFSPELGETNPFLHLSLHMAIREQVTTDRPMGIKDVYQAFCEKHQGDHHQGEHEILDVLVDQIWKVFHNQAEFNEQNYLRLLQEKISGKKLSAKNEEFFEGHE